MQMQAIVLAAGQGTRMNHPELPKVLVPANGQPLVRYVLESLSAVGIVDPVIVVGFKAEMVRAALGEQRYVLQERQDGTGSAARLAESELGRFQGGVYLMYGDAPCISPATLRSLHDALLSDPALAVVITTGKINSVSDRYGRIVRGADGTVDRIVEYKDATEEERAITEYNAGPYAIRSPWLWDALSRIKPSPVTGEYYVTDIVEIAKQDGMKVAAWPVVDQSEAQGVNTPEELARAEEILRGRK